MNPERMMSRCTQAGTDQDALALEIQLHEWHQHSSIVLSWTRCVSVHVNNCERALAFCKLSRLATVDSRISFCSLHH